MYKLFFGTENSSKNKYSTVDIYHNINFEINDLISVFYPSFGPYYPYEDLVHMIYSVAHIFAAYDNKTAQCVASALVNNTARTGGLYIALFGVHEFYQGQGVGSQLLNTIIQWARNTGHTYIHLHVHVLNHKAIGLYEKVGFRKYQYIPNYYGYLPKRPPHAFEMVLPLS